MLFGCANTDQCQHHHIATGSIMASRLGPKSRGEQSQQNAATHLVLEHSSIGEHCHNPSRAVGHEAKKLELNQCCDNHYDLVSKATTSPMTTTLTNYGSEQGTGLAAGQQSGRQAQPRRGIKRLNDSTAKRQPLGTTHRATEKHHSGQIESLARSRKCASKASRGNVVQNKAGQQLDSEGGGGSCSGGAGGGGDAMDLDRLHRTASDSVPLISGGPLNQPSAYESGASNNADSQDNGDDHDVECETDEEEGDESNYEPILTKILNEKKMTLASCPDLIQFLADIQARSNSMSRLCYSSGSNKSSNQSDDSKFED